MTFLAGQRLSASDITALVSDTLGSFGAITGWTQISTYRKIGPWVIVTVNLTRTGANFTGTLAVGTLPVGIRPSRAIYDQAYSTTAVNAPVRLSVSTGGSVDVASVTVNTSASLSGEIVFPV